MKDGKHVILYIDDEQDMRDAVRVVLESNGYTMVEAPTAETGLRVYRESHPDLVIVDLMMPLMRTRKSTYIDGVGADADALSNHLTASLARPALSAAAT